MRGTRPLAMLVTLVSSTALLDACRSPTRGFSREIVVSFNNPAGDGPQRDDVRSSCAGLPGIVTEPVAVQGLTVRFDIRKTDDRQLAALYACLGPLERRDDIRGVEQPGDF